MKRRLHPLELVRLIASGVVIITLCILNPVSSVRSAREAYSDVVYRITSVLASYIYLPMIEITSSLVSDVRCEWKIQYTVGSQQPPMVIRSVRKRRLREP